MEAENSTFFLRDADTGEDAALKLLGYVDYDGRVFCVCRPEEDTAADSRIGYRTAVFEITLKDKNGNPNFRLVEEEKLVSEILDRLIDRTLSAR